MNTYTFLFKKVSKSGFSRFARENETETFTERIQASEQSTAEKVLTEQYSKYGYTVRILRISMS